MKLISYFQKSCKRLESDLEDILLNNVAPEVDSVMSSKLWDTVYSYQATPKAMESRRYDDGGLWDPDNIVSHVEPGLVLVVENVAPFQDGRKHDEALPDVVEQGLKKYRQPGPRPFISETEDEVVSSGRAAKAVMEGLKQKGYKTN